MWKGIKVEEGGTLKMSFVSIKDAQFTRLRELSMSYTLNTPGFQEKTKLNSIVFTDARIRGLLLAVFSLPVCFGLYRFEDAENSIEFRWYITGPFWGQHRYAIHQYRVKC